MPPSPARRTVGPEHVGPALRRLRQLRGMTQTQIAERCGCSKAMLSSYERGRSLPRLPTLFRVLDGMGWRVLDFGRALEHVEQHPPAE